MTSPHPLLPLQHFLLSSTHSHPSKFMGIYKNLKQWWLCNMLINFHHITLNSPCNILSTTSPFLTSHNHGVEFWSIPLLLLPTLALEAYSLLTSPLILYVAGILTSPWLALLTHLVLEHQFGQYLLPIRPYLTYLRLE